MADTTSIVASSAADLTTSQAPERNADNPQPKGQAWSRSLSSVPVRTQTDSCTKNASKEVEQKSLSNDGYLNQNSSFFTAEKSNNLTAASSAAILTVTNLSSKGPSNNKNCTKVATPVCMEVGSTTWDAVNTAKCTKKHPFFKNEVTKVSKSKTDFLEQKELQWD